MQTDRFKHCLATDYDRLRELAEGDPSLKVPTCPEWSLADLVSHVAHVYLHKVETLRGGGWPDPWPPEPTGETPAALLERGYQGLETEFAARPMDESALTWYGPDQTVGFWLRRMAHETVIHRIDAELANSVPTQSIPDDLALDGIDEILVIFLAWACAQWPEDFADTLAKGDGSVGISAGPERFRVSWDGSSISAGRSRDRADAEISGSPEAVLRWLWRRAGDEVVELSGDVAKVAQMRALLAAATQ